MQARKNAAGPRLKRIAEELKRIGNPPSRVRSLGKLSNSNI